MQKTAHTTIVAQYRNFLSMHANLFSFEDRKSLRSIYKLHNDALQSKGINFGNRLSDKINVIEIVLNEVGLGKSAVLSILLHELVEQKLMTTLEIDQKFNTSVSSIIHGMMRVAALYARNTSLETENFRKLFLTFAEDVRVILIIIAEHLNIMRTIESYPEENRQSVARESSFLYAPLAHRMGLYAIKTELEDLSLKSINRDVYDEISSKLKESKETRELYIHNFITPLKLKLDELGFKFEIKGRTKSINSIYSKIKKQNTPFEKIYDIFAIRIIFDVDLEKEKSACWQAYSIVADQYQPNPKRLRDWLSIPKSNGYESLHTTVMGPDGKWVEVQIRTQRMDEVAEKGLAAHWKYKGIKSESGMDEWLKNLREILENPELNAVDFMDEFKLNLYDKEVFVFTPKGDLHKLPKGATVLDFAFSIHSNLGSKCMGAKVNGKNVPIKHTLVNGDQVEVLTSPTQKPNVGWLKVATTSRAKNKIRQALKEFEYKDAEIGREIVLRRFKNWKIEIEDGKVSRLAKKKGYKTVSDFYQDIANESLDMHVIRDAYIDLDKAIGGEQFEIRKAETFYTDQPSVEAASNEDVLVIGEGLKGIEFNLAKCCHPIFGDEVFGFVSVAGGIKIHKNDCPNAPQMAARFGYRIVKARWSGKSAGSQYPITLRIIGHDDIGIVTNVTSLISKEKSVSLRSISVDSVDGLFQGNLTIMVGDTKELDAIIKKIRVVKGVKSVSR